MNILFRYIFLGFIFLLISCQQKQKVDFIIKDSFIYTMDKNNSTAHAMAVTNGKIVDIGDNKKILNKYTSDSIISLKNKYIYPAFIDAHAHFFGLAYSLGQCNLYGTTSIDEIISRLKKFYQENPNVQWIIGRGWDQNLFTNKQFPTKESLDSVFQDIPVCLTRVDGHAVWTNSKAIEIAKVNHHTVVNGGEILKDNQNKLLGIFIDNATDLITQHIPPLSKKQLIPLLLKAQEICLKNNIHCVHDAGLDLWQIQLIDSLQSANILSIRIYAMASLNKENLNYFLKNGWIDKEKLKVRAFKIYADGALGSRGALLKKKYADIHTPTQNEYGLLLINQDTLNKILSLLKEKNFQVCTHAIGDSANKIVLQAYSQHLQPHNHQRWRIEHAQVVDKNDLWYFKQYKIIPSVQPTHAISDKSWAIDRLGTDRIKTAYAYQSLWQQNNLLALGTDFPVEDVSPLKTFFAAVYRTNYDLKDSVAFQQEEALSKIQTLRGMTIDAAYAAFMENEIGSLEIGKLADFIILDIDLMKVTKEELSRIILSQNGN